MSKKFHYTAEQIARSEAKIARFKAGFLGALRKANELGITDMTKNEAESYLESKGIKVEDVKIVPVNPEILEKGTKLIAAYIEAGIYKFEDIMIGVYDKIGDEIKDWIVALKQVYLAYSATVPDEIDSKMTDRKDVRSFNVDNFIKQFNQTIQKGRINK